eukprot:247012_1
MDKLSFLWFIDIIQWNKHKIPMDMTMNIINNKIIYLWYIDKNRLNKFLQKKNSKYFTLYSDTFRNGMNFYWLRISHHGGMKLYLGEYQWGIREIHNQRKVTISIDCSHKMIGYDITLKGHDFNNIDHKLYPSNRCRYYGEFERNITSLKSIR